MAPHSWLPLALLCTACLFHLSAAQPLVVIAPAAAPGATVAPFPESGIASAPGPSVALVNGSGGALSLPGVQQLFPGVLTSVQNVTFDSVNYYYFVLPNATVDISAKLIQYQGDADLYIVEPSNPAPFAANGFDTNGWTSGTAANESIFISRADPFYTTGTYAVGVQGYGKGSSQYQLLVHFTSQNRTLIPAQRTVLQTIFNTCCNSSVQSNGACSTWLDAGGLDNEPCEYPNWECSLDGQLEIMDFSSFGLVCDFPWTALTNISSLEAVKLTSNYLNGQVEWTELAKLPNLQTLDVDQNFLEGPVGCDLATPGTPFLEIDVSDNNFSGALPSCYVQKPEMRVIRMNNNYFTGSLPATVPANSELRSIHMANVGATGTLTADYGLPLNLMTLEFSSNNISGRIPDGIVGPKMDSLYLNDNDLTGPIPTSLTTARELRTLALNQNQLTGGIDDFASAPYLQQVSLQFNNLTGRLPQVWSTPNLISISIRNNFISGLIPLSLLTQPKLIIFAGGNNLLSGPLPALSGGAVSALRVFNVTSNQLTGPIPASYNTLPVFDGSSAVQVAASGKILQQVFDASYNILNGTVPMFFQDAQLPAWAVVDLSGNELTCSGGSGTTIANVACGAPAGVSTGGQAGPLAVKGPATGPAGTPASTPQTVISVVTTPSPSAAAAASLGSSGSSAIPVVSSRSGGGGGGLSTGAIVGIVMGIIAGVIILAAVAILVVSRVTKHRRESVRAKSFQRFASMDAEPV